MHNPYQSPASLTQDLAPPPARRPLSAWLLMLILGGLTIFFAIGVVSSIWFMVMLPKWMNVRFAADVAFRFAIVACGVGGMLGIARRRRWGRWLGLVVIAGFTVVVCLMPDTAQYANDTQRSGGAFGRMILFPSLMAFWGYRFAFSDRARRYFAA